MCKLPDSPRAGAISACERGGPRGVGTGVRPGPAARKGTRAHSPAGAPVTAQPRDGAEPNGQGVLGRIPAPTLFLASGCTQYYGAALAVAAATGRGWRDRVGIALAAAGVVLLAGVQLRGGLTADAKIATRPMTT